MTKNMMIENDKTPSFMAQALNSDDLVFISWFINQLKAIECFIVFSKDGKSFSWQKRKSKNSSEQNCKKQMLQALNEDLLQGTQTYQYHFCSALPSVLVCVNHVIVQLVSAPYKTSSTLKLRLLDLFEQPPYFFKKMLMSSGINNDSAMMMELLKKGQNYGEIKHRYDEAISQTCNCYKWLIEDKKFTTKQVAYSFSQHLKNSTIIISEVNLINLFSSLFSEEYLPILFNTLEIKKEELITQVKEQSYLEVNLSLKTLASAKLSKVDIEKVIAYLSSQKDLDFPSMSFIQENEGYIHLLIKKENSHSEAKVRMFFDRLVSSHYNYNSDEKNDFSMLTGIIQQINEFIQLDNALVSNEKKKKFTIKV